MLKTKATAAFWTSISNQADDPSKGKSPESVGTKFRNGPRSSPSSAKRNSWSLQRRRAWSGWALVQELSGDWVVEIERHVCCKRYNHVLPSLLNKKAELHTWPKSINHLKDSGHSYTIAVVFWTSKSRRLLLIRRNHLSFYSHHTIGLIERSNQKTLLCSTALSYPDIALFLTLVN